MKVAVTAYGYPMLMAAAGSLMPDEFLRKPFEFWVLRRWLEEAAGVRAALALAMVSVRVLFIWQSSRCSVT